MVGAAQELAEATSGNCGAEVVRKTAALLGAAHRPSIVAGARACAATQQML
jgi:thiamine pyrophosphate-dependent acetolactate synthase large subunit-like protein